MKKPSNFRLLIISLLFFQIQGMGQSTECAADYIHNAVMQTDSVYRKQIQFLESQIEASIQNHSNIKLQSTIYTIPVVVHVIHLGEPLGTGSNISDIQIQQAIAGLNDRFSNVNSLGVDVEVEFCLASKDPNGNSTNGINRVDGSSVANYSANGITPTGNPCSGAIETAIKDLSRWPVSDYYNIWVVSEICNGAFVGYASYPIGGLYDGLVIVSTSMTSTSGTLPHEVGHGFFLYHTFNGDGGNVFCPVDTNCLTNGDYVCDTPPHKQGDCGTTNPCTLTGVWNNSRYNYMAYCPLVNRFTQGQKDRMRATFLVAPRASLLSSVGCGTVGINQISSNNKFSVFPNPAQSLINVKVDIKLLGSAYVIYDNTGKIILKGIITSEITIIELGNLSGGIYFFSVGENLKQAFKVIKE
jgi:Pregnancy-associated plasma protein-A/Secretion system C-terminal sorting domain